MDLSQRGRCQRFGIEALEQLADRFALGCGDHPFRFAGRQRRHLVAQGGHGAQVGLRHDVGPNPHHLSQLDEGRAQNGQGLGEPLSPAIMLRLRPAGRPAKQDEAAPVDEERHRERRQPHQNLQGAHQTSR